MKILFRRAQARTLILRRTAFRLWCELELSEEEKAVIKHYGFDKAILYWEPWRHLIIPAIIAGFFTMPFVFTLFGSFLGREIGAVIAVASWILVAWFIIDRFRMIIWVSDVINGRHFRCLDVTSLALEEKRLKELIGYFRDMVELARNWDGNEVFDVPPHDAGAALTRLFHDGVLRR